MKNCRSINKIKIFPKFQGENEYLLNLSHILKKNGDNVEFVGLPLKPLVKKVLNREKSDILIINWLEDYPSLKKGFFAEAQATIRFIIALFAAKFYYRKVIWVRHNYQPHLSHSKICYTLFCKVISLISEKVVTHRPVQEFKSQVISHPLYKKTETIVVVPFDYLIFGNIKPYKNIPLILQDWGPKHELKIIGKCKDEKLDNEITTLIKYRLPNVIYENRFLEVEELNGLLSSATFVILGHEESSMIVSGTFYHAISYGANAVLKDSQYAQAVKGEFPLVHIVKDFSEEALSSLKPFARKDIVELANQTYSDSVVAEQWSRLLAD